MSGDWAGKSAKIKIRLFIRQMYTGCWVQVLKKQNRFNKDRMEYKTFKTSQHFYLITTN